MTLPTPETTDGDPKTKVFISYSRSDVAFADRLGAALEAHGLACPLPSRERVSAPMDGVVSDALLTELI